MISWNQFMTYLADDDPNVLESLAQKARSETQKRFGKTIELYAPLYVSNYCSSECTYCNFSAKNKKTVRTQLSIQQAEMEMQKIQAMGMDDILILTGEIESPDRIDFLQPYIEKASQYFTKVGAEIFPCSREEYAILRQAGISYVTIYQETYQKDVYQRVHRAGQKKDFSFRYETPQRVFDSGIKSIGMGILLGLSDPVADVIALAKHITELRKKYWDREYAVSFPRIRDRRVAHVITDQFLAKIVFLFRLLFPDATLILSTREQAAFRSAMAGLGINKMSAGSRTTVGGYIESGALADTNQFAIEDTRDVVEVVQDLRKCGLAPVRKNHEKIFS